MSSRQRPESDTIHDVRATHHLLPAPRVAGPTPEERRRLDVAVAARLALLDQQERRSVVRRARAGRGGPPLLVAACLVAVGALVLTAGAGGGGPRVDRAGPVLADPAAVVVLQRAATAALGTPDREVHEDQFTYTRSAVISNDGTLGAPPALGGVHEREVWFSQDPSSSDVDLLREFGQDWPMDYAGPVPEGTIRPTYAWLSRLPTDPDDLLDRLAEDIPTWESYLEVEQSVFMVIGDLLHERVVPADTQAALFEAVTRIPGVTVERGATDALDRPGIGISRADTVFDTRTVWVFDPETYELLGTRWYGRGPGADGAPTEVLWHATAVLERGVVDEAGQAPDEPAAELGS